MKIKKSIEKKLCGHCQKWTRPFRSRDSKICFISRMNEFIFFAYWYKFRKTKNRVNNLWVGVIENKYGLRSWDSWESAISRELSMNWVDFVDADQIRKAKNHVNNFWVCVVKNGRGLLVYGTLKSAISRQ